MAVVINGSGTVTGLAVGGLPDGTVDAGTLATDSVTAVKIPDTVEADLKSGRKNLIINGGFDVWQRGTTGTIQGYNSTDRWYIGRGGGSPVVSIARVAHPTDESVVGGKYYLEWTQTTGGTGSYLSHRAEELKNFLDKELTLSFWVKADSAITITDKIYAGYGTGQPTTLKHSQANSVTTSWQKFTHTFTITGGGTIADNSLLKVELQFPDNNTVKTSFANVQLELGSVATDFEHRSYGEELALCKRYYEAIAIPTGFVTSASRFTVGTGGVYTHMNIVEKRVAPTVTDDVSWRSTSGYTGDPTYTTTSSNILRLLSTLTTTANTCLFFDAGTGGDIKIDSEL